MLDVILEVILSALIEVLLGYTEIGTVWLEENETAASKGCAMSARNSNTIQTGIFDIIRYALFEIFL